MPLELDNLFDEFESRKMKELSTLVGRPAPYSVEASIMAWNDKVMHNCIVPLFVENRDVIVSKGYFSQVLENDDDGYIAYFLFSTSSPEFATPEKTSHLAITAVSPTVMSVYANIISQHTLSGVPNDIEGNIESKLINKTFIDGLIKRFIKAVLEAS